MGLCTRRVSDMKGFIKFASILTFGVFCFIGGVAKGHGKNGVALYCILGGTMMLLNGFASVTEIETNDILGENRKYGKKNKGMKEIGK